ncbi:MAG: hypothetical protein VX899_14375 [Myxococcota bacterium]|nr:hypothetical protein [Myxococcota bacterium]
MRLTAFDPPSLRALEHALHAGRTCTLATDRLPRSWRSSQILPCFDGVDVPSHTMQRTLRAQLPPTGQQGKKGPRVTAVIPTHRQTPVGLQALRDQDLPVEVLVLANGPVAPQGDRVLRVPWLGHGPTRQAALEHIDSEYLLFTVDDALPRGRGCVRALIQALEDGGYDAVTGRQVPWPTADPLTRRRLAQWTPFGTQHSPRPWSDHVFTLLRTETLRAHPLPSVPIGEDMLWSRGKRIGYAPQAPVIHSHVRDPKALYQRTRDLHLQHQLAGDAATVPSLSALVAALPGTLRPTLEGGPGEFMCQLAELAGQLRASQLSGRRQRED